MDSLYNRGLSEVGQEGNFQKRFDLFYNVLLAGLWSIAYHNIILALTITPHLCEIPEKPPNISEDLWKMKYIPTVKDAAEGTKFSDCLVYTNYENNVTKECTAYNYDKTWFTTTIPSENNWVCDNEIYVSNALSYSRIGETIGSLIFGWYGDVYGRKPTYIISIAMLIVGRFMSIFASTSFVIFAIGFIVASLPSWSATQCAAVISLEMSSPNRRATVTKLRLVAISFGKSLMPLFYWWLKDWKLFMIITTVTQLPCLLVSWKLIDSPQWLWANGKSKQCVKTLKDIAKVNQTNLSESLENEILASRQVATAKAEILGPLALFSGWRLAINTTLQLLLWVTVSLNYTVLLFSSAEKSEGNPFLDFAWQSLIEVPGLFIASWLADRIGRRYTGMLSTSLATVIWVVCGFRETNNVEWLKSPWIGTFLVMTNRLTMTVAYYIIDLLNMELYPTCLRQSGMSLGNVVSGAASSLAPYILLWGRRIDARYPSIILVITNIFGGVLTSYLLPETKNVKLPETLEDAQTFGRRDRTHFVSANLRDEIVNANINVS